MIVTRNGAKRNGRKGNGKADVSALVGEVARPLAEWSGRQLLGAVRGIVSAYRQKGGTREEVARVVGPLSLGMRQAQKAPKFQNVEGGIRFTHTEAVAIESTSVAIQVSSEAFSWLSQLAGGFEEYRIKCEFGYVPICPATTVGSVMMAWDYDPDDTTTYTSYSDFFNTADHCIGSCWAPCAITPKVSGWLKTGTEGEARFFSPGVFKMNQTSGANGYTMVRYTVELRKAQPSSSGYAVYTGQYTSNTALTSNATLVSGSSSLITLGSSGVTQRVSGRILVVWSTDANCGTFTHSGGMLFTGSVSSAGRSIIQWYTDGVGNQSSWTCSTVPTGGTSYKLVAYRIPVSPVYA